jgi:hypothetical protein
MVDCLIDRNSRANVIQLRIEKLFLFNLLNACELPPCKQFSVGQAKLKVAFRTGEKPFYMCLNLIIGFNFALSDNILNFQRNEFLRRIKFPTVDLPSDHVTNDLFFR